MLAELQRRSRRDDGFTLLEMIVSFLMITVLLMGIGTLYVNSQRTQALTERTDKAVALGQAIIAKAQQVPYANLGYYSNSDRTPSVPSGFTARPMLTSGQDELPLWRSANGTVFDDPDKCSAAGGTTCPTRLRENPVDLRTATVTSRPAGTSVFAPSTQIATGHGGVRYRVDTWVTSTADGARRVTIQTSWPAPATRAGVTCGTNNVRCATQTYTRYPFSSDQAPDGTTAPAACSDGSATVCQTFVRGGRVLHGSTLAGLDDAPQQIDDVVLYARTAKPATGMRATWTWLLPNGTTKAVSVTSFTRIDGDASRWIATIPADVTGEQFKGQIRPGTITVRFTAAFSGSPASATADQEVTWSYASEIPVTASLIGAKGTCSPSGNGTTTRLQVTGLSIGFKGQATQADSARDRVEVTYTVKQGAPSSVRTVTVPASLDQATVVEQYNRAGGVVTGGWVDAQFTVASPPDQQCPDVSPNATVTVHRASDGTSTPLPVTLLNTTRTPGMPGGGPVVAPPTPAELAAPSVTGARVAGARQVRFTWAAVPGASGYRATTSIDAGPGVLSVQTATTITIDVPHGKSATISVTATNDQQESAPGTASAQVPLFDAGALVNGWTNYLNGYQTARYTMTTEGVVVLSGLIRGGSNGLHVPVMTLPPGYRPESRMIFNVAVAGTTTERFDVMPDGRVLFDVTRPGANPSGWVSLDGIIFAAAGSPIQFANLSPQGKWSNYGGDWGPAQGAVDGLGRVHLRGLLSAGDNWEANQIIALPTSMRSAEYLHMAQAGAVNTVNSFSVIGVSGLGVQSKNGGNTWQSLNVIYPSSTKISQRLPLPLHNGWVVYPGHSTPSYYKDIDGLVMLQGLVRAGGVASGTVIAKLPVGHRPSADLVFHVANNMHYARVDVLPNGDVVAREGMDNAWLALEGITFVAEQ